MKSVINTVLGFLTTPLKACACAGEQGSRGAGESSSSNIKFFPLCPSAPLLLCSIKAGKLVRNAGVTSGTLALAIALTPISTIAAPVVRTIFQSMASGEQAKLQTINVWNGHGVAISFYELGETIKKVWLDDPSQILLDTDGCLEGLDENCSKGGAGLIHLRRIKKVNIPGIPQTSTTLLTVITQSSSGERKAYSFRLATSNGTPKYSQVAIKADVAREQTAAKPQLQSLVKTQQTINQIRGGIVAAIKSGWMNQQDELHQRLQKLIGYFQAGDDIYTAANKASVSQELVNKLIALSKSSDNLIGR